MRIFKTKWFTRFARRERLSDEALVEAIARADGGLVDAELGGHLIKQRIARSGQGRSGGYRSIIVYRRRQRAIFVFGFAKNDMDNLSPDEEAGFKKSATEYLSLSEHQLDGLAATGTLTEIDQHE